MFLKPVMTKFSNKYGNNRWLVKSIKLQRIVYLYSDLEYANWLKLENDPNVKYFCEQPLRIESKDNNGKYYESIPDMYVLYKNGIEVIQEVKYEGDLLKERVIKQVEIQKDGCMKNNYKHEVVTEKSLSQSALLLSNLKLLSKYGILETSYFLDEVKKHLSSTPKTLGQTSNEMGLDFSEVADQFFSLIKNQDISANIKDLFLGPLTEVWIDEAKISGEV
ncbi:TnsA endonuclease N-terminal domain-containing protein [Solibacillus cecembensis]|uniref:TnsA endonuclease N-terminal domain-containing protein n=1 Tax=Solibacillus cecembensis TaxID=459347 RepID=UPI003D0780F7